MGSAYQYRLLSLLFVTHKSETNIISEEDKNIDRSICGNHRKIKGDAEINVFGRFENTIQFRFQIIN